MSTAAAPDLENANTASRPDAGSSSAATSKPSTHKPSAGKPTKQELESLIALIHQSESIQSERIQAIVDGAILAVEQVQDKRIDLLEQGPEVTFSDVVFDIFISVCFIGVGKALVPITQSIARELVQTASYYGQVQSAGKVAGLAKGLRYAALAAKADFKEEYKFGSITAEEVQKYNKYVRNILVEAAEEQTKKFVEEKLKKDEGKIKAGAKEGKPKPQQSFLASTDTPGVAILSAAQSYVSGQRAAIAVQHAGFEAVVRSDPDNKTLELIRKAVTWSALNEEINAIRDKHKMLFEAVIWAQLFGFDQDTRIRKLDIAGNAELPGVTQTLMSYWRRRFARTIELWLSSLASEEGNSPYGTDLRQLGSWEGKTFNWNPGGFESASYLQQVGFVIKFFGAVTKDLTELYKKRIGEGAVQITTKPVAKK